MTPRIRPIRVGEAVAVAVALLAWWAVLVGVFRT